MRVVRCQEETSSSLIPTPSSEPHLTSRVMSTPRRQLHEENRDSDSAGSGDLPEGSGDLHTAVNSDSNYAALAQDNCDGLEPDNSKVESQKMFLKALSHH